MDRHHSISARAHRLRGAATVAVLLLLAACGGAAEEAGGQAAPSADGAAAPSTQPSEAESAAPVVDAIITGVDYRFEVGDISAGDTVGFVNGATDEAHEMVVMKVTDDAITLDEIKQLLQADPEAPPPAYLKEAGFAFAMPGETAEQTVTLGAGRYLLMCFIPQHAPLDVVAQVMESSSGSEPPNVPSEVEAQLDGPPHAAVGMIDLIEVK